MSSTELVTLHASSTCSNTSVYNLFVKSFDKFEGLLLLSFDDFNSLRKKFLHALLAANLQSR
jgi:hypothetical protein